MNTHRCTYIHTHVPWKWRQAWRWGQTGSGSIIKGSSWRNPDHFCQRSASTVSPVAPPCPGGHRPCALAGRSSDQFQSHPGAQHSFTCFHRPNGLLHVPGQQDSPSDPGDGSPTWHQEVSRCCLLFRSCCGSSRPADLDLLLKQKFPFPLSSPCSRTGANSLPWPPSEGEAPRSGPSAREEGSSMSPHFVPCQTLPFGCDLRLHFGDAFGFASSPPLWPVTPNLPPPSLPRCGRAIERHLNSLALADLRQAQGFFYNQLFQTLGELLIWGSLRQ